MSTVKLYLNDEICLGSGSVQCTTCGPASFPKSKCTPCAAMSLQSNAHDACGSSDAAASSGRSNVRDLEGAMAEDVMTKALGVDGK
jgi:hypothetical protein